MYYLQELNHFKHNVKLNNLFQNNKLDCMRGLLLNNPQKSTGKFQPTHTTSFLVCNFSSFRCDLLKKSNKSLSSYQSLYQILLFFNYWLQNTKEIFPLYFLEFLEFLHHQIHETELHCRIPFPRTNRLYSQFLQLNIEWIQI